MKQYLVLAFTALPALAAAEVKMYGQIKSGIAAGQVKISGSNGSEKSAVATEIVDNTSRFGFKGSEKISDDLKAVWQVEQRISVINAREGWATRDSFVGLEGKFGKLRAGNISNQLNWMDNIDPWMYSNNALGLGVFTRTGNRKASIRYDTPKLPASTPTFKFPRATIKTRPTAAPTASPNKPNTMPASTTATQAILCNSATICAKTAIKTATAPTKTAT